MEERRGEHFYMKLLCRVFACSVLLSAVYISSWRYLGRLAPLERLQSYITPGSPGQLASPLDKELPETTSTTTTTTLGGSAPASPTTAMRKALYACGPPYRKQSCDAYGPSPCCSEWGWCGGTRRHCDCADCIDFRKREAYKEKAMQLESTGQRTDLAAAAAAPPQGTSSPTSASNASDPYRCGPSWRRKSCEPKSQTPCCNAAGRCGSSAVHCSCKGCVDFRQVQENATKLAALQAQQDARWTTAPWGLTRSSPSSRSRRQGRLATCLLKAISRWPRPWLLLIGDSNWRKLYDYIFEQFMHASYEEAAGGDMTVAAHSNGTVPSGYDSRWIDRDRIWTVYGRPVRVSLRFMWNASARLETWTASKGSGQPWFSSIQSCGRLRGSNDSFQCVEQPQPSEFSEDLWNTGPHVVVAAHGLWKLQRAHDTLKDNCRRQQEIGQLLHDLLQADLRGAESAAAGSVTSRPDTLLWASNVKLKKHPIIDIADVDADRECQVAVARNLNIPLLDTYKLHTAKDIDASGYHLNPAGLSALLHEIVSRVASTCLR
eukprot:TRINITY_DN51801_c0_g1_i1.p1 TRINITY_DN51801_c0_g1~~TRINITY_DN51801_c0_g1_i1.p1  ORF type:complete len:546 (+),score=64.70 TRINITY_DN51801_c0_g1_i1:217-1854(+)